MRPDFELDPGLLAPQSTRFGTERHTLPGISPPAADTPPRPLLDGLADDFFAAGDDGCYAGSAALEPDEIEEDEAPVTVIVRTPEMEARRAKLARVVAVAVGSFAALFALGLARNVQNASASASEQRPVAASTTELQGAHGTTAVARSADGTTTGSRSTQLSPATRSRADVEPSPASNVAAPPSKAVVSEPARVGSSPPSSPARPATGNAPSPVRPVFASTTEARAPSISASAAASPRRALPSVVDFAARAGDAPKTASRPPTAAFAPLQ